MTNFQEENNRWLFPHCCQWWRHKKHTSPKKLIWWQEIQQWRQTKVMGKMCFWIYQIDTWWIYCKNRLMGIICFYYQFLSLWRKMDFFNVKMNVVSPLLYAINYQDSGKTNYRATEIWDFFGFRYFTLDRKTLFTQKSIWLENY